MSSVIDTNRPTASREQGTKRKHGPLEGGKENLVGPTVPRSKPTKRAKVTETPEQVNWYGKEILKDFIGVSFSVYM